MEDLFDTVYSNDRKHRIRFVHDGTYETRGSYAYDTPEENQAAEEFEIKKLDSGDWVIIGMVVQAVCPNCGAWETKDSLWGIVIEDDPAAVHRFAAHDLELPPSLSSAL